jgi:hypothetical protein
MPSYAAPGTKLESIMPGEHHKATVVAESPWDPDSAPARLIAQNGSGRTRIGSGNAVGPFLFAPIVGLFALCAMM